MGGAPAPPPPPPPSAPAGHHVDAQPVPWGAGEAVAVFFLSVVLTLVVGEVMRAALAGIVADDILSAVYGPLTLVLLGLVTVTWVGVKYRGATGMLAGSRPHRRDLLVGLGAGVAAVVVVTAGLGLLLGVVLEALEREIPPVQQDLREAASDPRTAPLFLLSALVIAPLSEELYFRGMVFPAVAKRLGVWPGIVLSASLFGVIHLNQAEDLVGAILLLLRLVPLGMFFAWIYHRRGTILTPVIAHSIFNAASVALMFAGVE